MLLLVAFGAVLLLISVYLTQRFRRSVPAALHSSWQVLTGFICFFVAGYIAYILMQVTETRLPNEILVSFIFFGGSFFVYSIISLTGRTLIELRKLNDHLEEKVYARTEELTAAIKSLVVSQNELTKKNTFLDSVLNALTHPFYVLDANTFQVVLANKASGMDGHQEKGTCHWLTHGESDPCTGDNHPCTVQEIRKTGGPVVLEHVHRDKKGERLNVEVHGYPLYDDAGNLVQVIEYLHDITEKKKAEEALVEAKYAAEAANRAKSEFLANMNHQLRTPLNHIIGFSEILAEDSVGKINTQQRAYLNNVIQSSHHLLSLINDLLDLGNIDVGRESCTPQLINLGKLIERCKDIIKDKALIRNITIDMQYDNSITGFSADESKLRQIINMLLVNAVTFSPDGAGITLTISRGTQEGDEGEMLQIAVADTGQGIPQQLLGRIFTPCKLIEGKHNDRRPGTGLGLSLCKKLVEIQGGKIWAESEGLGKGSRFVFLLPFIPPYIHELRRNRNN